ncbi:MAG: hypothetical protein ABI980_06875 [Nitrospirota bacterium]
MDQEQFKAFWIQLKPCLKIEWDKITEEDLLEIDGDLARFTIVIEERYGAAQKGTTWVNRRYSHWSGNYDKKYANPEKKVS